jgi:hypothetical protein
LPAASVAKAGGFVELPSSVRALPDLATKVPSAVSFWIRWFSVSAT